MASSDEEDTPHLHDVAADEVEEGDDEPVAKRAKIAPHFAEVKEKGLLWVAAIIAGCDYSTGVKSYGYTKALAKVAESPLTKCSSLSQVVAFITGFSFLEEDEIKRACLSMLYQTLLAINMVTAEESECERLNPAPSGMERLIESSCGSAGSAGLSLIGLRAPVDPLNCDVSAGVIPLRREAISFPALSLPCELGGTRMMAPFLQKSSITNL